MIKTNDNKKKNKKDKSRSRMVEYMKKSAFFIASVFLFSGMSYAATAPREHNISNSVFHSGLNFREIEKMILEGLPKIEGVKGRDILLLLGNSGAGKSTIVNYLLGTNMMKGERGAELYAIPIDSNGHSLLDTEGNVIDHSQVPAVMAHADEMISCTLFPQSYDSAASSYVLLDSQGFGEDRGPEGSVVASILTEMAVRSAKSVRIAAVVPKNDITRDGRDRLKSLCLKLHKLIKVRDDHIPIGFIINKADDVVTLDKIINTAKDIIKGEKTSFSLTISSRIGRLFNLGSDSTIPESLRNDLDIQRRAEMLESMKILHFIINSQQIIIANIFGNERGRQDLHSFIESLPVIPLGSFQFNGYSDARTKFNNALIKMASNGLSVLQAKASLARHIETIQQIKDEEEAYATLCLSNIENGDYAGVMFSENVRLTQLENNIQEKRIKLAELKDDKNALENDKTKIVHWKDSWNVEWHWWCFLWWRCYQVRYNGASFDDFRIELSRSTNTLSSNKITDYSGGYFDRDFDSDSGNDCNGEVILYKYKCNTPSQKEIIKKKEGEIKTIKNDIEQYKKFIEDAHQKYTDAEGLKKKYEDEAQRAQKRAKEWDVALGISNCVDKTYNERKEEIDQTYSLTKVLSSRQDDDIIGKFVDFYDRFQLLIQEEGIDLPNSLVDPVTFSPLLNAVQAKCGHVFNKLSIALHLERSKTCPQCRASVLEGELVDVPHINRVTEEHLAGMMRNVGEARAHTEELDLY